MNCFGDVLEEALRLLISGDSEVYHIILLSLLVSTMATFLASLYCLPLGVYLGIKEFRYKKLLARFLYTMMSFPSVVVGLIIAMLLSRRGPLGFLQLLYTPTAMIIAQTVLVTPLLLALAFSVAKNRGKEIEKVGITLGARRSQLVFLVACELKSDLLIHVVAGFSRAISEVGAVMIVGGNIRGETRVMTTTIAMLNSMGDYAQAIALGIVLILVSFIVNSVVHMYREP